MSTRDTTENGSSSAEDRTKPSEPEKKEEEISLRPGGGLSLRPGGGFGFGMAKSSQSGSVLPATKPFRSSSQTESSSPSIDLGGKEFPKVKEEAGDEDRPDGFVSRVDKMIYNRQFLMQFQSANTDLPEGLQFVFAEAPDLQREPSSASRGGSFSARPRAQSTGSRATGSSQQRQQKNTPPPSQSKGINQVLPRRAKDRWEPRPSFLKDEKDQVLRSVTGVLNRITPEKFEKLTSKLCDEIGAITDEEVYREAVSLVFMKAVSEPNFSKMYADLCVRLNAQPVALPDQKLTFRRVLLNKCQEEFESAYMSENKDLPENPDDRIVYKEKLRRRKLGNVKFIGELFKSKLLSEKIIQECIKILFDSVHNTKSDKETMEHHCELVCKLLTTIGKLIDSSKATPFMQQYFEEIQKLSQDDNVSSRIRFMFQDLAELRKNNWVPRREENTPKTIGEVHAEALARQFQDEVDLSSASAETKSKQPAQQEKKEAAAAKKRPQKAKAKPKKEKLTDEELEKRTNLMLEEYLSSGDFKEVEQCIKELGAPHHHPKIIEAAIVLTLDKRQKDRDLVSKLFSELSPEIFSEADFVKGFKLLTEYIDELDIDIPSASTMLGSIVGRAVVDNCLSLALAEKEMKKEKVRESMMQTIHAK